MSSWETFAVKLVALGLFAAGVAWLGWWIVKLIRTGAVSEQRANTSEAHVDALERAQTRETRFRALDRDAQLKRLSDRYRRRKAQGVPRSE